MLRVHEELTTLQGHSDPLEIVADRFKAETDVLCFDGFCLRYYRRHAVGRADESPVRPRHHPVATSNIPPDELYRNGLQRAVFCGDRRHQAALRYYERRCGIDYRLRTLTQAHLWLSPLNNDTREQMDKLWLALAGAPRAAGPTLDNHRELPTSA